VAAFPSESVAAFIGMRIRDTWRSDISTFHFTPEAQVVVEIIAEAYAKLGILEGSASELN